MNAAARPPLRSSRLDSPVAIALGLVGLLAFPLAGAALVVRLVEPRTFVALSLTALVFFGAAMMKLHRRS